MKPQGYDIDIAELIAKEIGVKVELVPVTSANRIPYLQTHKVDLVISSLGKNPEREKVIDFSEGLRAVLQRRVRPGGHQGNKCGRSRRQDRSASTRGAVEDHRADEDRAGRATIKRYEDNNAHHLGVPLRAGASWSPPATWWPRRSSRENPPKRPETKFLIKNSPCYVGLNKDEPKLLAKVNEIIEARRRPTAR